MNGEDIKAGSSPILLKSNGREAPAVAARVVIDIKLIPIANPIMGPSPCHQAKGITTNNIRSPNNAPDSDSFNMAFRGPMVLIFCVLKPRITTVEL